MIYVAALCILKILGPAIPISKMSHKTIFLEKSTTTALKGQDDYSIVDGNINYAPNYYNDDYYDSGPGNDPYQVFNEKAYHLFSHPQFLSEV